MNQPPELCGDITIALGEEDIHGIASLSIRQTVAYWHIMPAPPTGTPEHELRALVADLDDEWAHINQPRRARFKRAVVAGVAYGLALSCLLMIAVLLASGTGIADELVLRLGAITAAAGFTAWRTR